MKKTLNRDRKKGAVYVQLLNKGDLFNEEYTLSNCCYFVESHSGSRDGSSHRADVVVKRTVWAHSSYPLVTGQKKAPPLLLGVGLW